MEVLDYAIPTQGPMPGKDLIAAEGLEEVFGPVMGEVEVSAGEDSILHREIGMDKAMLARTA